ncbi:predicted protein [Streptomyces viridochromogenes DSM 40736]|uniref:Predicted protein n=1 Tax=Streptomyces viridochromogenes (strain DSM 40736 / JCM 4977 / BCRC 1201 / Tue 494) TaxID=591159 RepID=D9WYH2_STRVT|nr:predicted protein [Streptomyces viridochromogenes DSM 40736]
MDSAGSSHSVENGVWVTPWHGGLLPWGWPDVTAGITRIEDEQASLFGVSTTGTRTTAVDRRASSDGLWRPFEIRWSRFACRYVYSATSVRRRRSDRITGAGVTEVQDDGRFPESGETGPRSAVRSGIAALFAAQVP